jgi:hypothetical protein
MNELMPGTCPLHPCYPHFAINAMSAKTACLFESNQLGLSFMLFVFQTIVIE